MPSSDDHSEALRVEDVSDIGQLVRTARKEQDLTQREFADIVGVGVRFLSELERGKPTAEIGLVLDVIAFAGYEVVLQRRGWSRSTGGRSRDREEQS